MTNDSHQFCRAAWRVAGCRPRSRPYCRSAASSFRSLPHLPQAHIARAPGLRRGVTLACMSLVHGRHSSRKKSLDSSSSNQCCRDLTSMPPYSHQGPSGPDGWIIMGRRTPHVLNRFSRGWVVCKTPGGARNASAY